MVMLILQQVLTLLTPGPSPLPPPKPNPATNTTCGQTALYNDWAWNDKAPTSRTINDQWTLQDDLMCWFSDTTKKDNTGFNNPRAICGVKILNNFNVLLEFDSKDSLDLLKRYSSTIWGLYTPPRVSMESTRTLWSLQRIHMDSMRTPHCIFY